MQMTISEKCIFFFCMMPIDPLIFDVLLLMVELIQQHIEHIQQLSAGLVVLPAHKSAV